MLYIHLWNRILKCLADRPSSRLPVPGVWSWYIFSRDVEGHIRRGGRGVLANPDAGEQVGDTRPEGGGEVEGYGNNIDITSSSVQNTHIQRKIHIYIPYADNS